MTATAPAPGWYPYGPAESTAEWDGRAWTGHHVVDSAVPAPPSHRRPLGFLTRSWLWLVLAGVVITAAAGALWNSSGSAWWIAPIAVGLLLALSGIVLLFRPRLRFAEVTHLPVIIAAGVVSGLIGLAVAFLLEGRLEPHLRVPFALDLWLSGPIEEACKIAVPVLLLVVARTRFGDPRAGVLMVLVSAAVFGVGEGLQYVSGGSGANSHLLQSLVRPLAEISHPLWTAIAAGAIWLAAHRSGRVLTWAGLVGWLVAAALHSLHDGLFSSQQRGTENLTTDRDLSMTDVAVSALVGNAISIIAAVITFLVLRHVLRELTPPTAVAENPTRWRPRLALWGVAATTREQWESEDPVSTPSRIE